MSSENGPELSGRHSPSYQSVGSGGAERVLQGGLPLAFPTGSPLVALCLLSFQQGLISLGPRLTCCLALSFACQPLPLGTISQSQREEAAGILKAGCWGHRASGGAGPLPVALPHISCWEVKSRAAQSQGGSCSLFSFPLVDKTMPSLPEFHLIAALYMCDYLALGMFSGWDRSQGSA